MAQNDTKYSTASNQTTLGSSVNEDLKTTFMNTQDQTLLKALQDLIVRMMDKQNDDTMNQIHLGSEAVKLITALQEFISSIVIGSRSEVRNTTIEVSLAEEKNGLQGPTDLDNGVPQGNNGFSSRARLYPKSNRGSLGSHNSDNRKKPLPISEEKLLKALREHIFNTMPIRMLSFKPHGKCGFQISLIERGVIFGRIASELRGKLDEEDFRPKLRWGQVESEQEVIKRLVSEYAQYAILSHTWLHSTSGSEVTYADWNKGLFDSNNPGYQKLVNFCKTAWKHNRLTLGWMDTICINKDSSSELDESIRSMYNWYKRAAVCIIYLAETRNLSEMHLDPWFTRGWTLQELLAPNVIKFYSDQWKQLSDPSNSTRSDKYVADITTSIRRATTITSEELHGIRNAPISRRMQLAATRKVTREEDTAYSLMGIFDVSISTAYGEGVSRAFSRLLQEMLTSLSDVLDIFNWGGELPYPWPYNSDIFPFSPKYYTNRSSNEGLILRSPTEPLIFTHLGLRIPLILMPGISINNSAPQRESIGDYNAVLHISPGHIEGIPTTYNLLDNSISGPDGFKEDGDCWQVTFAVFNFTRDSNTIHVPKTCIAFCLRCDEPAGEVTSAGHVYTVETYTPVVFELNKRITMQEKDTPGDYWNIERDELPGHGMQHTSLYL